jgi:hypothetical protein
MSSEASIKNLSEKPSFGQKGSFYVSLYAGELTALSVELCKGFAPRLIFTREWNESMKQPK